uniref:Prefoldin subunit 4 n=1 Tax=Aceria tosichella TaxID=561515 RepID=A0A6G1S4H3_9ACAR
MVDPASSSAAGDNSVQGVMNVSKEDQTKINRFARLNARLEDVKEEISSKTNELKNYEDAVSEAEMKVLEDQGDKLHLQVGDILINLDPEKTQKWLEDKMELLKKSVAELEDKKANIVEEMSELKTHLYARFGNNIHLES